VSKHLRCCRPPAARSAARRATPVRVGCERGTFDRRWRAVLDRLLANVQQTRDLAVGLSDDHAAGDVALARGQHDSRHVVHRTSASNFMDGRAKRDSGAVTTARSARCGIGRGALERTVPRRRVAASGELLNGLQPYHGTEKAVAHWPKRLHAPVRQGLAASPLEFTH